MAERNNHTKPRSAPLLGAASMPAAGGARSQMLAGASMPVVAAARSQFVVPVLDLSGSMAGGNIAALNAALLALVSELAAPACRNAFVLSPVIYGSHAQVLFSAKRATELQPAELTVSTGTVGGLTAIGAGLDRAREVLEQSPSGEGWLRPIVLLMTDGHQNWGADPEAVATQVKTHADLVCVAFGANADLTLLQRLATTPDHAVRCSDGSELRRFFAKFGSSVSVAARTGQSAVALLGASKVLRG